MDFFKQFKLKELFRFCVGGGSAVIVDLVVYLLLENYIPTSAAKAISFILGAIVGFLINKFWTFESKRFNYREVLKYCVLYACSAVVNTLVNEVTLYLTQVMFFAWFVATGCSTVINFLGQKFFVFRKSP